MNLNTTIVLNDLVEKYNVAAPRYTSYPTVPFWDNNQFSKESWSNRVFLTYQASKQSGISLYIHLPFCESLCTYCGCNTRITKNHTVEIPYIDSLLKEWGMYIHLLKDGAPLISEIHLGGGTPTFFSSQHLEKLITGILAHAHVATDASFSFEAHPGNTTHAHLKVLYGLGFRRLSLGIQDFDPLVQFVINRKQDVEDVQRVMKEAREIGYTSINFDLIYGLPKQKLNTVRDTIEKSLLLSPDRISFYSYAHVPWIKPGQRHYTEKDLPYGADKLALYTLGKQLIQQAGYEDVGMDHFAKPNDELFIACKEGRLHRNFMGYADRYRPLLIGLGVSAISDAWNGFAQNVKTVEEYQKIIEQDQLPVVKGHLLNEEDLTIRRYILDIMCKGETRIVKGFAANEDIVSRLQEMIADDLVIIDEDYIMLTSLGKPFLRNVCMAFDLKLQRHKEKEQLFSQAI
ncbi:oxygen-independent coproporphyrinogen III oxidase [Sphingobacterium sp. SRCM116780]|uniref:oxygen-independent coproporphyrinogen III oxidase n=1 Tax=Sphingobacterium sp. SRCM116780 TaxID=2907623 RepID=UPI001F3B1A38|nr:oxygen-independent coproporphyrinogen III oxidase [Sphingobacterium sp. SRCM116780]UIR56606.1 oxygen-independent coproporphyrinogen III oxidase [Sphingobacterium sp. SRCM116780]